MIMETMQESSLGLEDLQESPLMAPAALVMLGHRVYRRYRFKKRKMFTTIRPSVAVLGDRSWSQDWFRDHFIKVLVSVLSQSRDF